MLSVMERSQLSERAGLKTSRVGASPDRLGIALKKVCETIEILVIGSLQKTRHRAIFLGWLERHHPYDAASNGFVLKPHLKHEIMDGKMVTSADKTTLFDRQKGPVIVELIAVGSGHDDTPYAAGVEVEG